MTAREEKGVQEKEGRPSLSLRSGGLLGTWSKPHLLASLFQELQQPLMMSAQSSRASTSEHLLGE